jgi:hypothetical protein
MKKLYTAKTIYRHDDRSSEGPPSHLFEERMVILQADSRESAIATAEKEANDYADQFDNVNFAGYIDIFELAITEITVGAEFYSLIRRSNLDIDEYIDRFYDTGNECDREVIDKNSSMTE